MIKSKVSFNINKNIKKQLGFERGGKAQLYVATQFIKIFDSYTPMRSSQGGTLKTEPTRNLVAPYESLYYKVKYAKVLYYNPRFNFNEAPRRGAYWDKRAWADKKLTFLKDFQMAAKAGKFR